MLRKFGGFVDGIVLVSENILTVSLQNEGTGRFDTFFPSCAPPEQRGILNEIAGSLLDSKVSVVVYVEDYVAALNSDSCF